MRLRKLVMSEQNETDDNMNTLSTFLDFCDNNRSSGQFMKRGRNENSQLEANRDNKARMGGRKRKVGGENDQADEEVLKNIKIHPLLQMPLGHQHAESGNNEPTVNSSVKVRNPLLSDWKQREGFVINPYINQSDLSLVQERKRRAIRINEPGKHIERANTVRLRAKEERLEREREEELKKLNLIPDESIGENHYGDEFNETPPYIEWWDAPFLKNGMRRGSKYDGCEEDSVTYKDEESEDNPITSYIQHPIPLEPPWTRLLPEPKPLFLTKKEQKRLRKNRRMLVMSEKQDRVKLGLDAAPKPKVKLKNLMNVLTNETIRNPTEVEMRVRQEIQERADEHRRMNEERKLSKEEKRQKVEHKADQDRNLGIYRCVFTVDRLVNPKHIYKVDMNAKQLMLTGVCVSLKDGKSLIIVEGGFKGIEKYKKLMLVRVEWTVNEAPRMKNGGGDFSGTPVPAEDLEDLSRNRCSKVWEGEVAEAKFHKWTEYTFETSEAIIEFLGKYGMENYWQQSVFLGQLDR